MKNRKKAFIIIGIIVVLVGASGWLFNHQHQQAIMAKKAADLETVEVKTMDLSDKIDVTGEVTTKKNASLYPPYNATVKQILVKPGDTVKKGDVLIILQLDDADMVNYSAGWRSSLEQARENLTVAKKALEREKTLYQAQATTIDTLESAQNKVLQYQAQVNEYQLKLESLAKNGVKNDSYVHICAPFNAQISWIDVKLEETVTTSTKLLTLGGNSIIQVDASVDQGDIDQVKNGLEASITANDTDRTVISGVVTSFGSTGTTSSNVVVFPVTIKPAQCDKTNLLKVGMSVDVTILANSHPNVLAVPLKAVQKMNGRSVVMVMKNGRPSPQEIQLGYKNTTYGEVLSGLSEGDRVILSQSSSKIDSSSESSSSGSKNNQQSGGMMGPMGGPPPGG